MRGKIILAGLFISLFSGIAAAQDAAPAAAVPDQHDLYCAGTVTTEAVPQDTYLISGEESNTDIVFNAGNYVYINKGATKGVKVGDRFSVIRPTENVLPVDWTKWQTAIFTQMGTLWEDEGRLTVTVVRPDVSIAQVDHVCSYLERGDIVLPFTERPAPPIKIEKNFDRFAPATGKPLAMIIVGKDYQQELGTKDVMYVNLGARQGVKVGDYFRIFRYTGTEHENTYQTPRYAFDVDGDLGPTYGYGSVSKKYNWSNVPREMLGEGLVLRTGPNSSTVLITFSEREIFSGDYVELE